MTRATLLLLAVPSFVACAELEPVRTVPAIVDPASSAAPEPSFQSSRDPLVRKAREVRGAAPANEETTR